MEFRGADFEILSQIPAVLLKMKKMGQSLRGGMYCILHFMNGLTMFKSIAI